MEIILNFQGLDGVILLLSFADIYMVIKYRRQSAVNALKFGDIYILESLFSYFIISLLRFYYGKPQITFNPEYGIISQMKERKF